MALRTYPICTRTPAEPTSLLRIIRRTEVEIRGVDRRPRTIPEPVIQRLQAAHAW
jgi:hypothetical protein